MAKGSKIIITADPKGHFEQVVISGSALYPGMLVETVAATERKNGHRTVQAVSRTAGTKGSICVLVGDNPQGFISTTVFVTGTQALAYWPLNGDELNMLIKDVTGTGDATAIGDKYGVNATGSLTKDTGSYASTPFEVQETIAAGGITADTLVWMQFDGSQA